MRVVPRITLLHLLASKIDLRVEYLRVVLITTCRFKNDLQILIAENRFLKGF